MISAALQNLIHSITMLLLLAVDSGNYVEHINMSNHAYRIKILKNYMWLNYYQFLLIKFIRLTFRPLIGSEFLWISQTHKCLHSHRTYQYYIGHFV